MKLVESEEFRKLDEEADEKPLVTPPRPPHRRVSVSLIFTLTILIGTVVTIYLVFPARDNVLLTEAIEQSRDDKTWELATPTNGELAAWSLGVLGTDAPPVHASKIYGARRVQLLGRPAAVMRVELAGSTITILVAHPRGIGPNEQRTIGNQRAVTVRTGKFALAIVGPAETAERWSTAFK